MTSATDRHSDAQPVSSGASASPTIGIALISWNRFDLLAACLESIRRSAYERIMIVVVDNGSTDGSPARLRAAYPEVEVIENGANLGFAGANNVGIRRLLARGADCVLLLNDDTEIAPDMLATLVGALYADERIGIVGPKIYYFDRCDTVWFAGGAVGRFGQVNHPGADLIDRGDDATEIDVDYICGCALMVKRPALERLGVLDERFFAYYEETEFCARARAAGFRVRLAPRAVMWHKVKPGDRAGTSLYLYLMARNRLLYLRATRAGPVALAGATLSLARTAASWALRPGHRAMRPHARTLALAVGDFFRGRFGPPPPAIAAAGRRATP
jgi:GT2 family glycosyltransferase